MKNVSSKILYYIKKNDTKRNRWHEKNKTKLIELCLFHRYAHTFHTRYLIHLLAGLDLTFQKWFLSFANENKRKTNVKCWPPWLDYEEYFSRQHPKTALNDIYFIFLLKTSDLCLILEDVYEKSYENILN